MASDDEALLPRWSAFLLIAFLMLAYTAGYAWSTPHTDTADELMRAYEIRHGLAYPLEGPFLGNALHLGPAWFYLVALPLFASHGWLAAALFIGFVCSLKFPLAYYCGRRLVDADFGVLWAACMFVPGFASLEQLLFLNPNAVAAAALLVLALSLRALERPVGVAFLVVLGAAMAFALHVHPTSAPIFVLAALVLWAARRRGQALVPAVAAIAAGFLLPFASYAVSEVRSGFHDWGSASAYLSGQIALANIVNAPAVIVGYLVAGPHVAARYLMRWSPAHATMLTVAMIAFGGVSAAALLHGRARRRLLFFVAALVIFAAWIACMRPTTPFQFVWILSPAMAAVVATGLWSLARMPRLRALAACLVVASIALNVYAIFAVARTVRDGEGTLPARTLDIKNPNWRGEFHDVWFPAVGHARLGRMLCDGGRASLHGHLAYVVDKDLGLDALFACNDRSRISLVGSDAQRHYFGMTRPFWTAFNATPECWVGSLGVTRHVKPLLRRAPLAIADGSRYLPRIATHATPAPVTFSVIAPADAGVMVTNVFGEYERFALSSADVDGRAVSPLAANDLSLLFAAHDTHGAGPVTWTFTVASTNFDAIDVVAIARSEGTATPDAAAASPACGS